MVSHTHNVDRESMLCFSILGDLWSWETHTHTYTPRGLLDIGLGDMAQKIITIIIFISVDIDNYHDKCQIFISFKFKARFLLQSESFRNQTINFP